MRARHVVFRPLALGRALLALSLLLLGPLGASGTSAAALAPAGPATLTNSVPDAVTSGRASRIGPLAQTQMLRLVLGLQPPHPAEEEQFLQQLQDKQSPLFHQYLTADEWNARFAPAAQDEQAVADWARANGLTVTQRYADRLLVDVAAPVSAIERAFNIGMNTYRLGTTAFYANDRAPTIPANLSGIVHAVLGLNSLEVAQPLITGHDDTQGPAYSDGPAAAMGESAQSDGGGAPQAATAQAQPGGAQPNLTSGYYDPTDLYSSQAYDWNALDALGHCCNPFHTGTESPAATSIAIATSGAFQKSDLDGFVSRYHYLAYNYHVYYVDGTPACCNGETTLDTEWSMAMANSFSSWHDTATLWIYEGADAHLSTFTDIYNFMLSDGHARSFSTSWGCTENSCTSGGTMDTDHNIFNAMVGQGWTLSAATGDQGAYDDCTYNSPRVQYPSTDPDVLAVGGTLLRTGNSFISETAWTGPSSSCGGNKGGGGGGVSAHFGVPSYQAGMGFSGRATPDVALNSASGQNTYFNGSWHGYGGTSIAAPEVAGMIAQENAYLLAMGKVCGTTAAPVSCGTVGQADYAIYNSARNLGAGTPAHTPFYDITQGCNGNGEGTGYCAGSGYDRATGWGSFNALQLAWALNWQITPDNGAPAVSFSGALKNTWYNVNAGVYWTVTDSGGTYHGAARPANGVAGFSRAWDADPGDPNNPGHPGSGTSFYSGPQLPNATSGSLFLAAAGQGCHTAHVRAWDNMGLGSGDQQWGPVCYDTIMPRIEGVSLSPASPTNAASITTTATADDPGCGSTGSCVARIYYYVNTATDGTASGTWTSLGSTIGTSGHLTWSTTGLADGVHLVSANPMDNAGNFLAYANDHTTARPLTLDKTAPVTLASLAGTRTGDLTYSAPVTVTLRAADNVSGVASTVYQLDGGAVTTYSGPFTVSTVGRHVLTYHSTDKAGNVESTRTTTFTIVIRLVTTSTVAGAPNPAVSGQPVTLTARVSAASGVPTGSVTFTDGSTTLGSAGLSNGVASLSTSSLGVGSHTITASYGGSAVYAPSSASFGETVKQAGSVTSLITSVNPAVVGQAMVITATVHAAAPGAGLPTGIITFKVDNAVVSTATLNAGGVAVIGIAEPQAATHTIVAVYNGDAHFTGSTSNVVSEVVNPAATTTGLVSAVNPSALGQAVLYTATVHVLAPSLSTPIGTVTFYDGSTVLTTAPLIASSNGVVARTIALSAAGTHAITAVYGGNPNYTSSTSTVVSAVVRPVTSIFTTQVPASSGTGAFELGVKFQSTAAGHIAGLRYYGVAAESGTHVGHLWSATGQLLGTVTFAAQGSSGWQTAYFATPIAISANTTYVASVNSNTAWAVTDHGLDASVSNGTLKTVADGGNGVYSSTPGTFPALSYLGRNYFRDVVFVTP